MRQTKTCALWNEHGRIRDQQRKELDNTIRDEFPPGTRVRWVHTYKYDRNTNNTTPIHREGTVSSFYGYGQVQVEMKKGGPQHRLHAHLLDIIEVAPSVGNDTNWPFPRGMSSPTAQAEGEELRSADGVSASDALADRLGGEVGRD